MNLERLKQAIIPHNEPIQNQSNIFTDWNPSSYYKSTNKKGETCLCGQRHIRHCNTIFNTLNGVELSPIGSSCINRFMGQQKYEKVKQLKKEYNKKQKQKRTCNVIKCNQSCHNDELYCIECFQIMEEMPHVDVARHNHYYTHQDLIDMNDKKYMRWLLTHHKHYQMPKYPYNRSFLMNHLRNLKKPHTI